MVDLLNLNSDISNLTCELTGTLKDVTRGVHIPWDTSSTDLIITTDSTAGSDEQVVVLFYNNGDRSGGIQIRFFSTVQYHIWRCTQGQSLPFPITPPEEQDKTWRIRSYQQALTVWCNDVKVLDVTLSDDVCDDSSWRDYWERETTTIKFNPAHTASDQYCTTPIIVIGIISTST